MQQEIQPPARSRIIGEECCGKCGSGSALPRMLAAAVVLFLGVFGTSISVAQNLDRRTDSVLSMRLAQTEKRAAVVSVAELRNRTLPKATRKLLERAFRLDDRGFVIEALALVDGALESSPEFVEAQTAAAIGNLKLGRLPQAERHLAEAMLIDSTLVPAREVQGILYVRQGRYLEARETFAVALKRAPSRSATHLFLAEALNGLGETDLASAHENIAEQLQKSCRPSWRERISLVAQKGLSGLGSIARAARNHAWTEQSKEDE